MSLTKSNIVRVDLAKTRLVRNYQPVTVGAGDALADEFGIELYRGAEPVDLSGCSVIGYFMRPNADTVVIAPETTIESGCVASVTLPQACYAYEGTFSLAIKVVGGDITGTYRIVDGSVLTTTDGESVDPGETIPDLTELLARIAEMEAATEDAEEAVASVDEALDRMVGVPSGYTRVEYIESNGTNYIDTGINGTNSTGVDIVFSLVETGVNLGVFGYFRSTNTAGGIKIGTSNYGKMLVQYGLRTSVGLKEIANCDTLIHTANFYPDHVDFDGENVFEYSPASFTTERTMYLFCARNYTGGQYNQFGKSRIYSCRIYEGSTDKAVYIPCIRNADGVVGFYERVTETFMSASGTGAFVAGAVITVGELAKNLTSASSTASIANATANEALALAQQIDSDAVENVHMHDQYTAACIMKQRIDTTDAGNAAGRFIVFTDCHQQEAKARRVIELANAWGSTYVDALVNIGDTARTALADPEYDGVAWYNTIIEDSQLPVLNTVGNHDAILNRGDTVLADKTVVYDAIIAPVKTNIPGIVQPTGASTNGYNYYYYDFSRTGRKSVRIIVLDCMFDDATEQAWFRDVLTDAKSHNMIVMAFSHYGFKDAYCDGQRYGWAPKGFNIGGGDASSMPDDTYPNIVKNVMGNNGLFAGWFVGHVHGCGMKKLKPEYGDQFVVYFDSVYNRQTPIRKTEIAKSEEYDSMAFVCIDDYYNIVRVMRIGADIAYDGTPRKIFAYCFANSNNGTTKGTVMDDYEDADYVRGLNDKLSTKADLTVVSSTPAASAAYHGKMVLVSDGTNDDVLKICVKASGSYTWKTL